MIRLTLITIATSILFCTSPLMAAEESSSPSHSHELDKYYIRVGGFYPLSTKTQIRADTNFVLSATIDTESTLGQTPQTVSPRIEGYWRYHPKHSIGFAVYQVNQNGSKTLEQDIRWDDELLFKAGTYTESFLDLSILKIDYTYSFYRSDKVELGLSGGLHATNIKAGIKGRAEIYDSDGNLTPGSGDFVNETASVLAPLPVVGFKLNYNFTPKTRLMYKADIFALRVDSYRGSLQDMSLLLEYQPWKHVGFGGGFNVITLEAEAKYDDGTLSLYNRVFGGQLYLTLHY